jgi:hypothetical protein
MGKVNEESNYQGKGEGSVVLHNVRDRPLHRDKGLKQVDLG